MEAQEYHCSTLRYTDYVFSEVDSFLSITYANDTTISGKELSLELDVFTPPEQSLTLRPLVIFFHGGGFMGGSKKHVHRHCIEFTKRGYVTAAANYRLIDDLFLNPEMIKKALSMAITDAMKTVIFFRRNISASNDFKIDPELIYVSGISAGGVIAAHLNFLDLKDIVKAKKWNYPPLFQALSSPDYAPPKAAISFSGALLNLDIIDSKDGDLLSFHNVYDEIVPCNTGISINSPFKEKIYGSCAIEDHLNSIDHNNHELIIFDEFRGHVSYMSPTKNGAEVFKKTFSFLRNNICDYYQDHSNYYNYYLEYRSKKKTNKLFFKTENSILEKPEIQIYNSFGVLRLQTKSQNRQFSTLNLDELERGIYFVHLGGQNINQTKKLLIY